MKKHIAEYDDLKDFVAETLLCSSVGRNENKRLSCSVIVGTKVVMFKVVNYVTGYEQTWNTLENAIENYNDQ